MEPLFSSRFWMPCSAGLSLLCLLLFSWEKEQITYRMQIRFSFTLLPFYKPQTIFTRVPLLHGDIEFTTSMRTVISRIQNEKSLSSHDNSLRRVRNQTSLIPLHHTCMHACHIIIITTITCLLYNNTHWCNTIQRYNITPSVSKCRSFWLF